jgi:hypothetical protein
MPLTRRFRETVQARARRGIEFRQALLGQAIEGLLDGNLEEGRAARSPGRARRKPLKPLRGECRVISGVTVVTTLVCFILFRSRGCGCIGHPAFPAPSVFLGPMVRANLGRLAPRDCRVTTAVIARSEATKQSTLTSRQHGLLRGACHRARIRAIPVTFVDAAGGFRERSTHPTTTSANESPLALLPSPASPASG